MSKEKKENTVFVAGAPVVTSTNPYEKYKVEYSLEESNSDSTLTSGTNKKTLRLECIKAAISSGAKDPERIMELAKRFWHFVRVGD